MVTIPGTMMPTAYAPYPSYPGGGVPPVRANPLGGVSVNSPEIAQALVLLEGIAHLPGDEIHLRQMGVEPLFQSGRQAMDVIRSKNIRVEFGDMGDSLAHAQWIRDENLIMINQKYRGDFSKASLYAISEAIYHEAGHASRLGDAQSSLQEEINCLALNSLAYRYHAYSDPAYAQTASSSRLIADGVALYAKLFFDPDPSKKALVNRIIEKYGNLPPASPDHPIPLLAYQVPLADRVMREVQRRESPYSV